MSGPKVVRIVTREELEAICQQHIAQLDDAIEDVRRVAKRLDRLDANLESELNRQRQILMTHFAAQQWAELQKKAPELVAGLRAHADRIRGEAVAAAALTRTQNRRLADGARSLVSALEAQGKPVEPALRQAVSEAVGADAEKLAIIQAVMNRALSQLIPAATSLATNHSQEAFAQRLSAGSEGRSLASWLASVPPDSQRDIRLDTLLAEVETRDDIEALHAFTARADLISAETDAQQRALLTDSLSLDVGRWISEQNSFERHLRQLREARARVAHLSNEPAAALTKQIDAAIATGNLQHADKMSSAANDLVAAEAKRIATEARRRAVLNGLAALGYEVRDNMATAWAQDGRLVVRKPSSIDYGVELGASGDFDRMQVRLVGADQPAQTRTPDRDRDQEVIWCSEFDQLRASLVSDGGNLIIERALGVGVQPVKTVTMTVAPGEKADEVAKIGTRTTRQI